MKTVPRPTNTYSGVQPGGVVMPIPVPPPAQGYPLPPRYPDQEGIDYPVGPGTPGGPGPIPLPPRYPDQEGIDPNYPDYPTQPPTVNVPPAPPVYPPVNPPVNPPITTIQPPVTPRPPITTQPPITPRPVPPVVTTRPPIDPPIVTTRPQVNPVPTPIPQPPPRPTTTRPLPNPLPAPQATVRTIRPPIQVAVAQPPTSSMINQVRPPARPAEFASVGGVPQGTPATEPAAGVKIRKRIEAAPGSCEPRPIKITKQNKKLDILFVLDTSSSLVNGPQDSNADGELASIARGVPELLHRVAPSDQDYRVAVMLAHGPTIPARDVRGAKLKGGGGASPHFGTLFSTGAEPAVLDRSKMSEKDIVRNLERKMMNVPNDYSDAQGEALIMGLFELTSNTKKLEQAHKLGFFGKDRNLVIIMVTDEQDVCFDYASKPGSAPTLKKYVNGKTVTFERDRQEKRFAEGPCASYYGHLVTFKDVEQSLHRLEPTMGGKVITQAIAYTKPQPNKSSNDDENEQGHGVIDLVEAMASGTVADMANVDRSRKGISFANELTQLGENAGFQMKYGSTFNCLSNDVHPDAINLNTLELRIADKIYLADTRPGKQGDGLLKYKIETQGSKKGLRVWPADQNAYERDMKNANVESANYVINFETKAEVDPKTGLNVNGSTSNKAAATKAATKPANKRTKR